MNLGKIITGWYEEHGRDLPWRETRDPYQIWISEIVLQQTRIQQGIQYYYRFLERFPDVFALAAAKQDEVLKAWEGLGYYSRARNLHTTAKFVVDELGGTFPDHYSELLKLKGIGPYTARAIGSFAFGNETAVLDGNVLRVVARYLGDFDPINVQKTRKRLQDVIDLWVKGVDSRDFNNGMMDLGSTVCTPTKPACMICPLERTCHARLEGTIHLLPVKKRTLKRKIRYYNFYLIWNAHGELAIRQRPESGLWGGLWEIPNEEVEQKDWLTKSDPNNGSYILELKHVFTHFDMMIHLYELHEFKNIPLEGTQFISPDKISIFAFARAVLKIFEKALDD